MRAKKPLIGTIVGVLDGALDGVQAQLMRITKIGYTVKLWLFAIIEAKL